MDEKKEYIPARLTVKAISFADIVTTSPGAENAVNKGVTNQVGYGDTDEWNSIINSQGGGL